MDIPAATYKNVFYNKMMQKYQDKIISATLGQLHEVVFNFAKRAGVFTGELVGLIKGSNVSKNRSVQIPIEGIIPVYGPGSLPRHDEMILEQGAVITIERWFMRTLIKDALHRHATESRAISNITDMERSQIEKTNAEDALQMQESTLEELSSKLSCCKACVVL
mmetsp:Transcript_4344/g.5469  ORF Transcript_4344/g.5469 Transcript_4344/m.5469 type:complete len:164 (+) Transcript_4344:76-567(+)